MAPNVLYTKYMVPNVLYTKYMVPNVLYTKYMCTVNAYTRSYWTSLTFQVDLNSTRHPVPVFIPGMG